MGIEIVSFREYSEPYRQAMRLLIENLPSPEMRGVAARLFLNPNNPQRTLACFDDQQVVGASVGGQLNSQTSYLEFIWFSPEYRRVGLGKRMFFTFEKKQRDAGSKNIETETYEPRVTEWMQRQGYKIISQKGSFTSHSKRI